jgi:DNA replication protein DnaC
MTMTSSDLQQRALRLGLHGLCAHWTDLGHKDWVPTLLQVEEQVRSQRSLERRIKSARLGTFRPWCDFDWTWPKKIDRDQVDDLFGFGFLKESENVLVLGPNGVGKTMLAKNLAHQGLLRGHTVLYATASQMLGELAQRDTSFALQQRLRRYIRPQLLIIDEVGYLSYDNRHADLLFEVVTRRYERACTSTVITTNKPFTQWNEVFPNASCVVTLIDRLTHRAELVQIEADSYRLKEAKQRASDKASSRRQRRKLSNSAGAPSPALATAAARPLTNGELFADDPVHHP